MKPKLLVAYSASATFTKAVADYIKSLKLYTDMDVEYLHVTHSSNIEVDFNYYDAVFNNFCARFAFDYPVESYREKLAAYKGVKILSVQDEYERVDVTRQTISEMGFDVVLTAVHPEGIDYVYPKSLFPNVEFVSVLTGYAPDPEFALGMKPIPLKDRSVVVGYRGRDIGGRFGRLGFQKYEIGRRMKSICEARGIAHDIAMDEASRIYGSGWWDFVGSPRTTLGSESGSNVFDFDRSIEKLYLEMYNARGGPVPYEEFMPLVADREAEIDMGAVSPRVFESATMMTPAIMYRGKYSGILEQDVHYIALDHDFGNIDEVLERIEDIPALEAMAKRARDDLVLSDRYSYRAFARMVESLIRERLPITPGVSTGAAAEAAETRRPRPDGEMLADANTSIFDSQPTEYPLPSATFWMQWDLKLIESYQTGVDNVEEAFRDFPLYSSGEAQRRDELYKASGAGPAAGLPDSTGRDAFIEAQSALVKEAMLRSAATKQAQRLFTESQMRFEASARALADVEAYLPAVQAYRGVVYERVLEVNAAYTKMMADHQAHLDATDVLLAQARALDSAPAAT